MSMIQFSFADQIQAIREKSRSQRWFRLRRWHGLLHQPGLVFAMVFSAAFSISMFVSKPSLFHLKATESSGPSELNVSLGSNNRLEKLRTPLGPYVTVSSGEWKAYTPARTKP